MGESLAELAKVGVSNRKVGSSSEKVRSNCQMLGLSCGKVSLKSRRLCSVGEGFPELKK